MSESGRSTDPFKTDSLKTDPFKIDPHRPAPFVRRPYDPERNREWIRGAMTTISMLVFAAVVAIYIYGAFIIADDKQWSRLKEALAILLPAVTSVLGSALGFYFGSQKK